MVYLNQKFYLKNHYSTHNSETTAMQCYMQILSVIGSCVPGTPEHHADLVFRGYHANMHV